MSGSADSSSKFDLAIIIVNYKTPLLVIDCLETLIPQAAQLSSQIVVVDNDSADDSLLQLEKWVENNDAQSLVRVLPSGRNGGFSYGNNVGIRAVEADFYLLLNSDTLVRPQALSKFMDAAAQFPRAGLIGPRLEWPDGEGQISRFRRHSPLSELIDSAATGVVTRLLNGFNVPLPLSSEVTKSDWVSFACVLIRKQVLDQVGLMDEGYFMYYEDVDFCLSAKRAGWEVINFPDAHIVHLRGGSSSVKSDVSQRKRLPKYYYESRTRYFRKNFGRSGYVIANLAWSVGWMIAILRRLLGKKALHICERQWLDIWTKPRPTQKK